MKEPGDKGVQGYPIEELATDPDATMDDAQALIEEYLEGESDNKLDSDAVINLIDFRQDDLFYWESGEMPRFDNAKEFGAFRVVTNNQFTPGLEVCDPSDGPGDLAFEQPIDVDEFVNGDYSRLLRDWLRGDVVPVKAETKYIRTDTGEEI